MKANRFGIWYLGKPGFQEFVQRKFHIGLFQLVGGWAISQLIPNKYACQLGFKQNDRRTWWSINEENKTTNIVTVPWNRLHDQTARITHITNEYAQTSGDGWVDQQCRRANGALSNKNDHQQFLMLFEHHLRSYQGREEATKSNNHWHDGFLGTGHGRETTAQQDHHGAIVLPILAVDRVSFELQWISRKIEYLSNLSFPIIHPQTMIRLKDHFQRENDDKPQSKDGSERHRSRTAGSNQSASPGNGQRWRQRSWARTGQDGPGHGGKKVTTAIAAIVQSCSITFKAFKVLVIAQGHTSPSSAQVHPNNSGKSSAQPSVKSPAKTKSLFRSHAHCKSLGRILQSSTSPQDTYPIPDKPWDVCRKSGIPKLELSM